MSLETMTKLATYTVSAVGGDSSISFSNIPQTYTDLVVKFSGRNTADSSQTLITLNGSTSYTGTRLYGSGSAVTSDVGNTANMNPSSVSASTYTANTFGNAEIYIPNYTSNNYKSISIDAVSENNAATAYGGFFAGLLATTAPITSITLTANGGNMARYSTATLYGVKAMRTVVGNSIKATGGNIAFDGTYVTHTFTTTNTFTPTTNVLVDYLVVAGGGGGGGTYGAANWYTGAGGGAGGLRSTVTTTGGGGSLESKIPLTANTPYAVTVGAGGAGGTGANNSAGRGQNGNDSSFATITSTAGGGGGSNLPTGGSTLIGNAGGSGGGGSSAAAAGAGTANQGYAGGAGASGNTAAGGGGGAGGLGVAGSGTTSGNGGIGVSVAITSNSGQYAGGGGGGKNGNGSAGTASFGGGAGGGTSLGGDAGTTNTGGGGGGASGTSSPAGSGPYVGGNGGSGIVIVRYKG
jgi:hypothetical protein